jgi:hypothetical protein
MSINSSELSLSLSKSRHYKHRLSTLNDDSMGNLSSSKNNLTDTSKLSSLTTTNDDDALKRMDKLLLINDDADNFDNKNFLLSKMQYSVTMSSKIYNKDNKDEDNLSIKSDLSMRNIKLFDSDAESITDFDLKRNNSLLPHLFDRNKFASELSTNPKESNSKMLKTSSDLSLNSPPPTYQSNPSIPTQKSTPPSRPHTPHTPPATTKKGAKSESLQSIVTVVIENNKNNQKKNETIDNWTNQSQKAGTNKSKMNNKNQQNIEQQTKNSFKEAQRSSSLKKPNRLKSLAKSISVLRRIRSDVSIKHESGNIEPLESNNNNNNNSNKVNKSNLQLPIQDLNSPTHNPSLAKYNQAYNSSLSSPGDQRLNTYQSPFLRTINNNRSFNANQNKFIRNHPKTRSVNSWDNKLMNKTSTMGQRGQPIYNAKQLQMIYRQYQQEKQDRLGVPMLTTFMIIPAYLVAGMFIFSSYEKWTKLDSLYFCLVTLTTIGFGDFIPGTTLYNNNNEAGNRRLYISALYIIAGLILISMCINLLKKQMKHKVKTLARKIGLSNC